MKKLGAHLSFLKVKSPTIKIFMDFSQQKMPHITEAHNNMESSLYYLEKNTHLSEEDLTFCFEERKELVLFCVSLNQSTIKAFHFLNWNLRVQFSEEKKKDQPTSRIPPLVEQVPQTTLNETVKEQVSIGTPKVVPKEEMKQALHTEGMGKPNDQQRGTKRKMPADSGKMKKQKEMHGKSYRASLYRYTFSEMSSSTLSAKCTVECGINMTFPQHLRQRILLPFLCTKSLLYNFCLMIRRGLRETP